MAIIQVTTPKESEAVFEKEIVQPVRKERFTVRQLDARILALTALLAALQKDRADAVALTTTEEPK
jgi:hypothetical protein